VFAFKIKHNIIYLYNILGWSSFPSVPSSVVIRPVIHPSNFLIPEEEDDGRGGEKRQQQIKKEENKLLINK
jgi:hypothetical protein